MLMNVVNVYWTITICQATVLMAPHMTHWRQIKKFPQRQIAGEWQSWHSNLDSLILELALFTTIGNVAALVSLKTNIPSPSYLPEIDTHKLNWLSCLIFFLEGCIYVFNLFISHFPNYRILLGENSWTDSWFPIPRVISFGYYMVFIRAILLIAQIWFHI